jgi:hypothetical protein
MGVKQWNITPSLFRENLYEAQFQFGCQPSLFYTLLGNLMIPHTILLDLVQSSVSLSLPFLLLLPIRLYRYLHIHNFSEFLSFTVLQLSYEVLTMYINQ